MGCYAYLLIYATVRFVQLHCNRLTGFVGQIASRVPAFRRIQVISSVVYFFTCYHRFGIPAMRNYNLIEHTKIKLD